MLIKPLIKKANIKSLPSNTYTLNENHPAYFGTQEEKEESINIEGRLLMLPLMYHEWNLKANKHIHDTSNCERRWPICECKFAKRIRIDDLRRMF